MTFLCHLCIFYKGEIVASFNGLMWKPQLREWIDGELEKLPDKTRL